MGSDFSLAVCFGLAWESLTEVFVQRIFHLAETIKLFPFKYAGSQRVVDDVIKIDTRTNVFLSRA